MAVKLTQQFRILAQFVLQKLERETISINSNKQNQTTEAVNSDPWGVVKKEDDVKKTQEIRYDNKQQNILVSEQRAEGKYISVEGVERTPVNAQRVKGTAQLGTDTEAKRNKSMVKSTVSGIISKILKERDDTYQRTIWGEGEGASQEARMEYPVNIIKETKEKADADRRDKLKIETRLAVEEPKGLIIIEPTVAVETVKRKKQ